MSVFSERLTALMKAKGLSQKDFEKKAEGMLKLMFDDIFEDDDEE